MRTVATPTSAPTPTPASPPIASAGRTDQVEAADGDDIDVAVRGDGARRLVPVDGTYASVVSSITVTENDPAIAASLPTVPPMAKISTSFGDRASIETPRTRYGPSRR